MKNFRVLSDAPDNVEKQLNELEDYTAVVWGITSDQNGAVTVTCVAVSNSVLRQAAMASGASPRSLRQM